jgi:hypothetical protein
MSDGSSGYRDPPWYRMLIIAPAALLFLIFLPLIALLSIPLVWVYPDRHMHVYDVEGTPVQQARLAQWRACYDRLGLVGRIRRARTRLARRRRLRREVR